jgi:hypothetical protein
MNISPTHIYVGYPRLDAEQQDGGKKKKKGCCGPRRRATSTTTKRGEGSFIEGWCVRRPRF